MSSGLFYLSLWTGPFTFEEVSGLYIMLPFIIEIPVLGANSVDPDQTPRSAVSDLSLHCLPVSFFLDTRHKCVTNLILCSRKVTSIKMHVLKNGKYQPNTRHRNKHTQS